MDISQVFPSDYLKASDLRGREVKVVIERLELAELGNETKPVIYFTGKEKGLVLNKTNARTIASMLGAETDDWRGKEIVLMPSQTDFQGRVVECIRVKIQNLLATEPPDEIPF